MSKDIIHTAYPSGESVLDLDIWDGKFWGRELTYIDTPENEATLIDMANGHALAGYLARVVRRYQVYA